PSTNLGEGVELRGHVWHPVKVLRIRSNLFAGTETLSLSVNEPIARQILSGGPSPPQFGGGGQARGACVAPLNVFHYQINFCVGTYNLFPLSTDSLAHYIINWGTVPPLKICKEG